MADATDTPTYYTLRQVAALLEVSSEAVRQWVHRQWMPQPLRPGGRSWRFRRDEVDEWIERGCPRTTELAGV